MSLKQTKNEQKISYKVELPVSSQTCTGTLSANDRKQALATPLPPIPQKQTSRFFWGGLFALLLIFAGIVVLAMRYDCKFAEVWMLLCSKSAVVWMLLCSMIVLGVIAAGCSIWNVWRAQDYFEKQRDSDIAFSLQNRCASVRDRVHDKHFVAFLSSKGVVFFPHRMHHVDRLQVILHIARQDETEVTMPALDDLRAYSYSVEQSKWSNWVVRIVISVLLITGILGTLSGVHVALDSLGTLSGVHASMDSMSEKVDTTKLAGAFLPSLVAVGGSIFMILLQAWYRHLFDAYMGKVDCHTLRYYFPWFRPDVLNEQSLKQFEDSFGQLTVALKRLEKEIKQSGQIPQEMDRVGEEIKDMQELSRACSSSDSVESWLRSLIPLVGSVSAQMKSLRVQSGEWEYEVQQLSEVTNLSAQSWKTALNLKQELLDTANAVRQKKEELNAAMQQLPNKVSLDERLKNEGGNVLRQVESIAENCNRMIDERYRNDVEQAKTSKKHISEIKDECQKLSKRVSSNVISYVNYARELNEGYARSEERLRQCQDEVEDYKNKLNDLDTKLKTRMEEYKTEPALCQWQIVTLYAMGAALLINLSITFILQ